MDDGILVTRELTVAFGGLVAVDGVSLAVRRGELLSVIGPNGAGKTTFFNLLCGIIRPTRGRVILQGRDITGLPPHVVSRLGLGRSFQIASLFPGLPVLENVRLAVQSRRPAPLALLTPAGRLRHLAERARALLDQVGLGPLADRPAAALSHGDKRKLEIAMLLATDPEVLLLDEPTAGMAQEDVPAVLALIRQLKASGRTILLVEHKIDMVMSLSDTVAVLHQGRLIAHGPPAQVARDPAVQQAYLGGGALVTPGGDPATRVAAPGTPATGGAGQGTATWAPPAGGEVAP